MSQIPAGLSGLKINALVLGYLKDLSAHSDVAAVLINAVKPLGDATVFCPDAAQCRYLCVSTLNVVFGFAAGMRQVSFRLDPILAARAIRTGADSCAECGPEWVSFTLFRDDWPQFDLPFWARQAYAFARESAP